MAKPLPSRHAFPLFRRKAMLFRDLPDGACLAVSQPMHALVSG